MIINSSPKFVIISTINIIISFKFTHLLYPYIQLYIQSCLFLVFVLSVTVTAAGQDEADAQEGQEVGELI